MRSICILVFAFVLEYTDCQMVDIDELYSLLQDRYQARSETGQPKTASPNPDEKIDVEGLTQRLDVLENEISFIRKAQQLEADRTEPDSIQSQVMILRRAFKAEKTVARKLKLQMISLNQQVEISLENLVMQIKEIMAKQSTHEDIIKADKASVDISHENLEIQIKALTEKQTSQEEVIQANKASVDISHENLEIQLKALTEKQTSQEEVIQANKASVDISHENLEIQLKALTEKQTSQEEVIQANKASVDISHENLEIQLKTLTEKQTSQEEVIQANKASVDISHENLEAQIKALTDKQKEIIKVNKASERKLKSQMNALTEKQEEIIKANKALVDISQEHLEAQLKALTEKQTTQEKIIKANKASVAQLSNSLTPPKVYFSALVLANNLKLSDGSKVVFEHVISQYGGGYNDADGVFTVPVMGVYLISVVLANENPTTTWLIGRLKVDSTTMAYILSENYHADQLDQSSNIAILKLWKGQKVWVEISRRATIVVRRHLSTFAAVLLHT